MERQPARAGAHRSDLAGVADAVDGADDRGAELAAQRPDVGVDGAGPGTVAVAPDVGEELAPG